MRVGWYFGNPGAFSYSHTLWVKGFIDAPRLGTHYYTASSQDVSNRFAASQLLYGSPLALPIPDLLRTDFLLMIGANPFVSHGSVLTAPRIKDRCTTSSSAAAGSSSSIRAGPRPRAQFEWLRHRPRHRRLAAAVAAAGDVRRGPRRPRRASHARPTGVDWLRELAAPFTPEATAERTGVAPDTVRALARDLAAPPRAAVYGRIGTCAGRNGTLDRVSCSTR